MQVRFRKNRDIRIACVLVLQRRTYLVFFLLLWNSFIYRLLSLPFEKLDSGAFHKEGTTLDNSGLEYSIKNRVNCGKYWRFLKKLIIELSYGPAILLLGIYPEKILLRKDTCTPMFTEAQCTAAKTLKQPKRSSTHKWIKKMWYIYTVEYQP